ncbi:hypothetical protein LUZ60_004466 [Juncus effusus]|nr:hypothetical protein LUZ60_004466 [Juncus effusus]
MAQESCNLDKEKSDLLKSSPSPSIPPTQPTILPKSHEEVPNSKSESSVTNPQTQIVSKSKPVIKSSFNSPKLTHKRCFVCNKKVGIPGFRCRCGELFCGTHRYSDIHDCSFDYKSAGREEIARANPIEIMEESLAEEAKL